MKMILKFMPVNRSIYSPWTGLQTCWHEFTCARFLQKSYDFVLGYFRSGRWVAGVLESGYLVFYAWGYTESGEVSLAGLIGDLWGGGFYSSAGLSCLFPPEKGPHAQKTTLIQVLSERSKRRKRQKWDKKSPIRPRLRVHKIHKRTAVSVHVKRATEDETWVYPGGLGDLINYKREV